MTISDTLLSRADEYQRRAAALRLAAAELDDTKAGPKPPPMRVVAAAAVQHGQNGNDHSRPGSQQHRDRGGDQTEGRRKVLLDALRRGPQPIKILTTALNDAGYMIQRDRVRQFLVDHVPEVHCEGFAAGAHWVLGKKAGKKKHADSYVDVRAQRKRSAKWLAHFNTSTPVSTYPKGMRTGTIGVYVRRGYLKRSSDGGYLRTAKVFTLDQQ